MGSNMDRRLVFGFMPSWGSTSSYNTDMVRKMAEAHTQSARTSLNWDNIEPNAPSGGQHTYDWSIFDAQIDLLMSYGIEPIETVVGVPWWARRIEWSGTATGGGSNYLDDANANFPSYNGRYEIQITSGTGQGQTRFIASSTSTRVSVRDAWTTPPASGSSYRIAGHAAFVMPEDTQSNRDSFDAFCRAIASRYQGEVRYYEFWNEPDGANMLFTANDYTKWLYIAHGAILGQNPGALLSIGGLQNSDMGYLRSIYTAISGLSDPEPDHYFDALAIHPYSPSDPPYDPPINYTSIQAFYDELVAHSDGNKSLWITEYGWSLDNITETRQDQCLSESIQWLTSADRYYVTVATLHVFADQPGLHWGVCQSDLTERPAYGTFRDYAAPRTPRSEVRGPAVSTV